MQDPSRPVTGYPVPNANGCAPNPRPPPSSASATTTTTFATAYPYQNPNPYPYTYYQQPPPYQNPRATFVRRLLFAFAAIIIIFGAVIFITWLVLRPRLPDFTLESFSLSKYNSSAPAQRVTATWNARFRVSNSNKKLSVSYTEVSSHVFYRNSDLAESKIPPFDQGTRNVTTADASFSLVDAYVSEKVVNDINKDRSNGQVKFDVTVSSWVGFRYGGWRGRRRLLRVSCVNVALNGSSGKMVAGAKDCDVY